MELLKWFRLQWDRVAGVSAMALGGILLLVCWSKVSGTPYTAEQVPYVVSCGIGGLLLVVVGGTLWHSADLRDQWRKLDRLEERFDTVLAGGLSAAKPATNGAPSSTVERPTEALAATRAMNTNSLAAYVALLLGVAGFGLLALSWAGASGQAELADQKGYLLLATLGLLTAAAGATISLSAQRRRLAARTADVSDRMAGWLEEVAR